MICVPAEADPTTAAIKTRSQHAFSATLVVPVCFIWVASMWNIKSRSPKRLASWRGESIAPGTSRVVTQKTCHRALHHLESNYDLVTPRRDLFFGTLQKQVSR